MKIFSVCSGVKQLDQRRTHFIARLRWNVLFGCNTVTTTTAAAASAAAAATTTTTTTTTKHTRIATAKSRFAMRQRVLPQYGHFPTVTARVVTVTPIRLR
jgi:hypothetical protein